jgi:hypothetical protein
LNSPPTPHAFVSLPLQSKISLKSFTKHLNSTNIITGIVIFFLFFFLRNFILPEVYITNIIFFENISIEFKINKDLFLGFLAVISRFSLKGFIEELLEIYSQPKLTIGDLSPTFSMNTDKFSKGEGGSDESAGLRVTGEVKQKIINEIFIESIQVEFIKFKEDMAKFAKALNSRSVMYDNNKITLDTPEVLKVFVMMLQDQTQFLNGSILKRIG